MLFEKQNLENKSTLNNLIHNQNIETSNNIETPNNNQNIIHQLYLNFIKKFNFFN